MFDHYRIPREALLNKNGDVTPDGQYVSPIKDDNLRFGECWVTPGLFPALELRLLHCLVLRLSFKLAQVFVKMHFGTNKLFIWQGNSCHF